MKKYCTPTPAEIGNNIRKWRFLKNYSQKVFADELEISIVALCKIETGKTDINVSRLCEIAHVLQVDVKMLFADPGLLIE